MSTYWIAEAQYHFARPKMGQFLILEKTLPVFVSCIFHHQEVAQLGRLNVWFIIVS